MKKNALAIIAKKHLQITYFSAMLMRGFPDLDARLGLKKITMSTRIHQCPNCKYVQSEEPEEDVADDIKSFIKTGKSRHSMEKALKKALESHIFTIVKLMEAAVLPHVALICLCLQ